MDDLYYHGKPCRHGHDGLRYKSNKRCVKCWRATVSKCPLNLRTNLAKIRKYKAARSNRVPLWADLAAIKRFYLNCPPGWVVDHIIPLRGKLVCGLHVANNLQYLTPQANAIKGNKFDPTTFDLHPFQYALFPGW